MQKLQIHSANSIGCRQVRSLFFFFGCKFFKWHFLTKVDFKKTLDALLSASVEKQIHHMIPQGFTRDFFPFFFSKICGRKTFDDFYSWSRFFTPIESEVGSLALTPCKHNRVDRVCRSDWSAGIKKCE